MLTRQLLALGLLLPAVACTHPPQAPLAEGMLPVSGGDSLHYRIVGRGTDTVVVLHGGPALSSGYIEAALRPLAESHILLFYDQRGRGRSSEPQSPDSLSFHRDLSDLSEVRSYFGLGRLQLVGHHWGAALAALYDIRHPEQVARMVLLSPMPEQLSFTFRLAYLPNDTVAIAAWNAARGRGADSLDPAGFCRSYWGFQFSPAEVTAERVVGSLAPAICDDPPVRLRSRVQTTRRLYQSLPGYNWSDSLGLASAPSLVVVGGESAAWLSNADLWVSRLRDARKLVIGRTALFPWAEEEEPMNRAIDEFLRGGWPAEALRVDSLGHRLAVTGL